MGCMQKYRSHRKHLLAREAEAVSWSQRRQVYATGAGAKRDINPWVAPTIGFVPPTPAAPPSAVQLFRPLHVWGHPTTEAPLVHMWLRHVAPRSPTVPWAPQPPPSPPDPAYWHHHYQRVRTTACLAASIFSLGGSNSLPHSLSVQGSREGWFPRAMTQGTPCFAPPLPTAVINVCASRLT